MLVCTSLTAIALLAGLSALHAETEWQVAAKQIQSNGDAAEASLFAVRDEGSDERKAAALTHYKYAKAAADAITDMLVRALDVKRKPAIDPSEWEARIVVEDRASLCELAEALSSTIGNKTVFTAGGTTLERYWEGAKKLFSRRHADALDRATTMAQFRAGAWKPR